MSVIRCSVIRCGETRRTETPNAVMTTLASPTLGGARQALWRVDMTGGQAGPLHAFDVEQVWTVLGGGASVQLDDAAITIGAGDTIVLPGRGPAPHHRRPGRGPIRDRHRSVGRAGQRARPGGEHRSAVDRLITAVG